ncbi:TolB family protein [Roseiflexus sp.]|uniref:TolB family protein n=1 Tax=Roseiflexus sp. TaxID=2562120 RepID=UPI00398A9593
MSYARLSSAICTLLASLALLSACAGASPSAPTAVPATTAPTAAPSVTEPPAATPATTTLPAPSPTPEPGTALLPAPLYVLAGGQIVRIERDGETQTQITNETPPAPDALSIVQFDVSRTDESIVYVVQGAGTPSLLVRTAADGSNRTVLLDKLFVNSPHISPDGASIVLSVSEDYERSDAQAPGLYVMPITGGEPRLILPNEPATDPTAAGGDGRGFEAVAWSPDGTKLLVNAFSLSVELCELAVLDVASGAVTYLQAPKPDLVASCTAAAWSSDSKTVYFSVTYPSRLINEPGIWRGDVASGAATSIPVEPANAIVHTPFYAVDRLYAFVAPLPGANPPLAADIPDYPVLSYTMNSVPLAGGAFAALRSDTHVLYKALWAPDGSGAIIFESSDPMTVRLLWLPTDGGPAVELYKGLDVYEVHWGRS